jgi:hypothetical protein
MDKDGHQRGTAVTVAPPRHEIEEVEFMVVALEGADTLSAKLAAIGNKPRGFPCEVSATIQQVY